jgi:orotate phosphoribosyltransferase
VWLDLDLLFRHPRRVAALAARLTAALAPHHPDVVCGPLVGGTLVAQLVAGALDVDLCWTERSAAGGGPGLYGARYEVPAAQRPGLDGATVAVVDDAVNAGSAVRASVDAVEACGAEVVAVGALLVLGDAAPGWAAGRGLPLERVAARANAIWAPEACPRCAAGEPLERVASAPTPAPP